MKKKSTKSALLLIITLMTSLNVACKSGQKDQDTQKDEKTLDGVFQEVVQALHAPYDAGEYFFPIIVKATNVSKTGEQAKSLGKTEYPGSGTWTLNAADATATTPALISITYSKYQPKGSPLIIDGIIAITEWQIKGSTKEMQFKDTSSFNLNISGEYEAKLTGSLYKGAYSELTLEKDQKKAYTQCASPEKGNPSPCDAFGYMLSMFATERIAKIKLEYNNDRKIFRIRDLAALLRVQ